MWNFLARLIGEKLKIFVRGFIPGGIAGITFLWGASFAKGNPFFVFLLKLVATAALAFASGLATVVAHDAWKYWLKPKWLKLKKRFQNRKINRNDTRRNNKAA